MFEYLAKYPKILVTGPHRSGTTFAATAIQYDLRDTHGLVREELCWRPDLDLTAVRMWLYETPAPIVMQAPFVADCCHQFPQAFVVFMFRDVDDIERSQADHMVLKNGNKVAWRWIARTEFGKYNHTGGKKVAELKYETWRFQRERLPFHLELEYESLRSHSLWVDNRKDFHVRQTRAVG